MGKGGKGLMCLACIQHKKERVQQVNCTKRGSHMSAKCTHQGRRNGWAQEHLLSQYFEQLAPLPPKYYQQTLGPTECVPLQYLTLSYTPAHTLSLPPLHVSLTYG